MVVHVKISIDIRLQKDFSVHIILHQRLCHTVIASLETKAEFRSHIPVQSALEIRMIIDSGVKISGLHDPVNDLRFIFLFTRSIPITGTHEFS